MIRLAADNELGHVDVTHVRATLRFVHVMSCHKERHAFTGELEEQIPQLTPRHRVNSGRWLVEKQDGWLAHLGGRPGEPLPPAAGNMAARRSRYGSRCVSPINSSMCFRNPAPRNP